MKLLRKLGYKNGALLIFWSGAVLNAIVLSLLFPVHDGGFIGPGWVIDHPLQALWSVVLWFLLLWLALYRAEHSAYGRQMRERRRRQSQQ